MNEYYQELYLTSGNCYDNHIFFSCSNELIDLAKQSLSKLGKIPAIIVSFEDSEFEFLNSFDTELKKQALARTYVDNKILLSLLNKYKKLNLNLAKPLKHNIDAQSIKLFLEAANQLKLNDVVEYYCRSNVYRQCVSEYGGNHHSFELDIFTPDLNNVYVQKAINSYIGGREPYCIKLFTTQNNIATYFDEGHNLIESHHDYKSIFAPNLDEDQVSTKNHKRK